jgi:hypothetical protein
MLRTRLCELLGIEYPVSIRSLSISTLRQRSTLYSAVWPRAVGIPLWSPCASWLKANSSP